jgi:multiple sugar transport system substrate-binding protein
MISIACFLLLSVAGAAVSKEITINIVSSEDDPKSIEAVNQIKAEYEKLHPNVEIQYNTIGFNEVIQKTLTGAVTGESVGIIFDGPEQIHELAARGLLEPVDDVIDSIGRDDFEKMSLLKVKGKTYFLPYYVCGFVMYYRADLFKKHGLQVPKTWDQLLKAAEKLTEDTDGDGKVNRYGIAIPASRGYGTASFFIAFLYANGGTIMDPKGNLIWNSKPVKDTLEFYRKLTKYAPPGISEYSYGEIMTALYSDAVAMSMYPARFLLQCERHNPQLLPVIEAMDYPNQTGNGNHRYATELAGAGIMKGIKNLDVAKDFLKFFMTGSRYTRWLNSVPIHFQSVKKSAFKDPAYWAPPLFEKKKETVKTIMHTSTNGIWPLYEWANQVNLDTAHIFSAFMLTDCVQEVLQTNKPIEEIVANWDKKMKVEIERFRQQKK